MTIEPPIVESPITEPSTPEPPIQILTIKTTDGDLFAGQYINTSKQYGRDVHTLIVEGIERWVPVNNCVWWAIGESSTMEARRKIREEMKEQAKQCLLEERARRLQETETVEEVVEQEIVPPMPTISIEKQVELRDQVRDPHNSNLQGSLRSIAGHQRQLTEKNIAVPNNQIIQPGEAPEPVRKKDPPAGRASRSMTRVADDQGEV
jgi:hypothetical protein